MPVQSTLAVVDSGDAAARAPALERTHATLLAASVPEPRTAAWTSNRGEPLVRYCTVPTLLLPELYEGASL